MCWQCERRDSSVAIDIDVLAEVEDVSVPRADRTVVPRDFDERPAVRLALLDDARLDAVDRARLGEDRDSEALPPFPQRQDVARLQDEIRIAPGGPQILAFDVEAVRPLSGRLAHDEARKRQENRQQNRHASEYTARQSALECPHHWRQS